MLINEGNVVEFLGADLECPKTRKYPKPDTTRKTMLHTLPTVKEVCKISRKEFHKGSWVARIGQNFDDYPNTLCIGL